LDVSLDDLVNYDRENSNDLGLGVPPKGKHVFGITKVGEKGQIVIPAKARKAGLHLTKLVMLESLNFKTHISATKYSGSKYINKLIIFSELASMILTHEQCRSIRLLRLISEFSHTRSARQLTQRKRSTQRR